MFGPIKIKTPRIIYQLVNLWVRGWVRSILPHDLNLFRQSIPHDDDRIDFTTPGLGNVPRVTCVLEASRRRGWFSYRNTIRTSTQLEIEKFRLCVRFPMDYYDFTGRRMGVCVHIYLPHNSPATCLPVLIVTT